MHSKRLILLLSAALLAGACSPSVAPAGPTPAAATMTPVPRATGEPATLTVAPAPTATPQAVATSRGPELEATDPLGVSLASGQIQLVEFFRFT